MLSKMNGEMVSKMASQMVNKMVAKMTSEWQAKWKATSQAKGHVQRRWKMASYIADQAFLVPQQIVFRSW